MNLMESNLDHRIAVSNGCFDIIVKSDRKFAITNQMYH